MTPKFNTPDFFIAGAAKAGTTSLYHYLSQHPRIFFPPHDKEPGYFCDIWGFDNTTTYSALFDAAKDGQLLGEASTPYLSCPASPSLIYQANPKAKIIISLRNPADRAFSLYKWMANAGHEVNNTFELALAAEKKLLEIPKKDRVIPGYYYNYLYYNSGCYDKQIQRYFDQFPREQIHILLFDDLISDPTDTIKKILNFLKIDQTHSFQPEIFNPAAFPASAKLQHFLKYKIDATCRDIGFRYGSLIVRHLMNKNQRTRNIPPFLKSTRQQLLDQYQPSIKATAKLIDRDLNHWLKPKTIKHTNPSLLDRKKN